MTDLPDFTKFDPLNRIKAMMGVAPDHLGAFTGVVVEGILTADEQEKLRSGGGIDVSLDDLVILPDGTISYKNSRVLLHIRDVHQYGRNEDDPRYHVQNCKVLQHMWASGRARRYVVATEPDGHFDLNIFANGRRVSKTKRLDVCQVCLDGLSFDGFSLQMGQSIRTSYVRAFTPQHFFDLYPQSLHTNVPEFDSDTAPLDNYTADWPEVSRRARSAVGWCCQRCRGDFSAMDRRLFLDVHHLGPKYDNRKEMLKVLCLRCHSDEPGHSHMRSGPRFATFMRTIKTLSDAAM